MLLIKFCPQYIFLCSLKVSLHHNFEVVNVLLLQKITDQFSVPISLILPKAYGFGTLECLTKEFRGMINFG